MLVQGIFHSFNKDFLAEGGVMLNLDGNKCYMTRVLLNICFFLLLLYHELIDPTTSLHEITPLLISNIKSFVKYLSKTLHSLNLQALESTTGNWPPSTPSPLTLQNGAASVRNSAFDN